MLKQHIKRRIFCDQIKKMVIQEIKKMEEKIKFKTN